MSTIKVSKSMIKGQAAIMTNTGNKWTVETASEFDAWKIAHDCAKLESITHTAWRSEANGWQWVVVR